MEATATVTLPLTAPPLETLPFPVTSRNTPLTGITPITLDSAGHWTTLH
jgi:hypothetical protein